jgi:hypothetical protein
MVLPSYTITVSRVLYDFFILCLSSKTNSAVLITEPDVDDDVVVDVDVVVAVLVIPL